MVDNSGSTKGTDPKDVYRSQTLRNFIQTYGYKENLTYSFAFFSTQAYFYDSKTLKYSSNPKSAYGDSGYLSQALQRFERLKSMTWTKYRQAVDGLQEMITKDEISSGEDDYVVVFMSDGQPTDIAKPVDSNLSGMIRTFKKAVESKGHSVTFSTVYFGPEKDRDAIQHLKVMAKEGGGQFVDANEVGAALNIADIITIPGQVCE